MNSVDAFGQAAYKAFIDQAPENNFLPPWGALSPEKREAWRAAADAARTLKVADEKPAPLCFVDTETDGLHDARQAWEIGIIRREPDGAEREFHAFVDIDLSQTPDGFGLRVGGYHERHPYGRWLSGRAATYDPGHLDPMSPAVAAEHVARMLHGSHVIGAVPSFDDHALERLLRANRLMGAWHYHLIDVETLAVGWLAAQGDKRRPPWHSDELSRAVGVEPPTEGERHTALGDARWVQRLYDKIMGE